MFLAVYDGENFGAENFGEALIVTFVSMFLVFIILILLYGLIALLKDVKFSGGSTSKKGIASTPSKDIQEAVSLDSSDEEAEVAAIVAAIEYKNEINKETKVMSIKKRD